MGDGTVVGHTITFASTDLDFHIAVLGALVRWTGCTLASCEQDPSDRVHADKGETSSGAAYYKLKLRSPKHAAAILELNPTDWHSAPDSCKVQVVRGFADANGSVGNYEVCIGDTKSEWCILAGLLLTSMGIECRVTVDRPKKHKPYYNVIVSHRWPLSRYSRKISFAIRRKKNKLRLLVDSYQKRGSAHWSKPTFSTPRSRFTPLHDKSSDVSSQEASPQISSRTLLDSAALLALLQRIENPQ